MYAEQHLCIDTFAPLAETSQFDCCISARSASAPLSWQIDDQSGSVECTYPPEFHDHGTLLFFRPISGKVQSAAQEHEN